MGFLTRIFGRESRMTVQELDTLMDRSLSGVPSATGVDINEQSALSIMALYAGVRLLSETIGAMPLHILEKLPIGTRRADEHILYPLLYLKANPEQTAMEWRETVMVHLVLRGNHFSEKQFDGAGRVVALWPIHPDRVRVEREENHGPLIYRVKVPPQNVEVTLSARQILHIRGLGSNGVTGFSPITLARETLGLAIATQEYGARLFSNDTKPGGVLQHPGKLSTPAYNRIKESLIQEHTGLTNAHRTMILEEGMSWNQVSVNPDDAQFLESRKFSVVEIARMLNLPPHFLRDLERATFSNIEQQAIEFVVYSLNPWTVRITQRLAIDLLPPDEWDKYCFRFDTSELLKGDIKTRFESYNSAKQNGWLSADEIRDMEGLNPLPEDLGKDYWQPVNIGIVGQPLPKPANGQPPEKGTT